MAKFNIEVELDWMDEEAYSIDDELRERIVKGVENALLEKATNEAVKAVDNKIAEKILEAEETIEGNKPFEIRKNDRDFQVGDVLILKEWDNIKYSGREIGAVVRYVLRDFIGLQEGYVALGLQILD